MSNPLVSILIPCYNVAKHIRTCLDSVCNQTYKNLEIILVEDASTDNTLNICNEYVNNDNRIKLIAKPQNEGVDKARFSALKYARGEYLMFVDSDDWLPFDATGTLLDVSLKTRADVVEGGYTRVLGRLWGG